MDMETMLINTSVSDFSSKSHGQSFFIANGINHTDPPFQIADIEMVALQSLTYTSLKDLLPASPPPIMSPQYNRKESWREIPIKDPLLQHAAWAYLQPMSTASEADDQGCIAKLKDKCGGLGGCFGGFFNDVLWTTIKRLFEDENENENENVDDDARKVD